MLGYRSVFHVEGDREAITDLTRTTLRSLLRNSGDGADMTGITECVEGALRRHRRTGGATTVRARVVESDRSGRRVTRLTVHVPASAARPPWIRVDVDGPDDGRHRWMSTARLVRDLQRLVLGLGDQRVRQVTTDASTALAAVGDRGADGQDAVAGGSPGPLGARRPALSLVVGGDASRSLRPRIDHLRAFVREAVSLAVGYVVDAFAGRRLAQSTGVEHTVAGASIRIYRTGGAPARRRRGPAPTRPATRGRRRAPLLRIFTWRDRVPAADSTSPVALDRPDACDTGTRDDTAKPGRAASGTTSRRARRSRSDRRGTAATDRPAGRGDGPRDEARSAAGRPHAQVRPAADRRDAGTATRSGERGGDSAREVPGAGEDERRHKRARRTADASGREIARHADGDHATVDGAPAATPKTATPNTAPHDAGTTSAAPPDSRASARIPHQQAPRIEPAQGVTPVPDPPRVPHSRRGDADPVTGDPHPTRRGEQDVPAQPTAGRRDIAAGPTAPTPDPLPHGSQAGGAHSRRALSQGAAVGPEAALAGAVRDLLGSADPTPGAVDELARLARLGRQAAERHAVLAARVDELGAAAERAELLRRELAERLEDEQLETATTEQECAVARAENDRLTAEVARLRGRLAALGQASEAWSSGEAGEPVDVEDRPASFEELLARIGELAHLAFTGSREATLELDGYDTMGTWAAKTWDALVALDDYARASHAGRCSNGVHGYLKQLPDGCRGFSDRRHASDESETVKNTARYARERTFPVPKIVSPTGELFMGAHFKIARSGSVSPRLHYFDDTAHTGRIYIGYLGKHLNNPHTN